MTIETIEIGKLPYKNIPETEEQQKFEWITNFDDPTGADILNPTDNGGNLNKPSRHLYENVGYVYQGLQVAYDSLNSVISLLNQVNEDGALLDAGFKIDTLYETVGIPQNGEPIAEDSHEFRIDTIEEGLNARAAFTISDQNVFINLEYDFLEAEFTGHPFNRGIDITPEGLRFNHNGFYRAIGSVNLSNITTPNDTITLKFVLLDDFGVEDKDLGNEFYVKTNSNTDVYFSFMTFFEIFQSLQQREEYRVRLQAKSELGNEVTIANANIFVDKL